MPRRTPLALLAFLAFVSLGLPDGLLGVSWPSIGGDFGRPLDALGLIVVVQAAGYVASSFFSGQILQVLPVGDVLTLSTAAAGLALLGFAVTPFWPLLVALALVAGLAGGAVDAGLNAYGATHFSARTLNWLHAFFGVGTTVGPLIVTAVLGSGLAWRWSYVIVGTAQLLLALAFLRLRRRWDEVAALGGAAKERTAPARGRDTLRQPVVWLGMAVFFFYTAVEVATAQWSYSLLTLGRGVPETTAGLLVSLYWGSLMVGRVLFGIVADRVPLVPALRGRILASIAGALLLWLEPTRLLSFLGLMLLGFGLAPIFASLISLTPRRVGAAHADSAIGFQISAAALGGSGLTALVGVVARAAGLEVIGASIVLFALVLLGLFELFVRLGRDDGAARGEPSLESRSGCAGMALVPICLSASWPA